MHPDNPETAGKNPRRLMKHILVSAFLVISIAMQGFSQAPRPFFWRGVTLFGVDEPRKDRSLFFKTLKDSLGVNVFQIKVFEGAGADVRYDFFLKNGQDIKVITFMDSLAQLSSLMGSMSAALRNHSFDRSIRQYARVFLSYPNHFRFYLRDEPAADMYSSWGYVRDAIAALDSSARTGSVTAFADTGSMIQRFATRVHPSELLVDAYFLRGRIPHPSLKDRPASISESAGIQPWVDYGTYYYTLHQCLNEAMAQLIRPAADAARWGGASPIPLIFMPQLHGEMNSRFRGYRRGGNIYDNRTLRPPSPSEIRLQYNIGIAYGASGFLAYPYGTEIGTASASGDRDAWPGLVSTDPSLTGHAGNFDTIFGKRIWTGYKEKWDAVAAMHARLRTNHFEDTLLALSWVGAKSWTIRYAGEPETLQTLHWNGIVASCTAETPGADPQYQDIPLVEIGNMKRKSPDSTDYIFVVNTRTLYVDVDHPADNRDTTRIAVTLRSGVRWRVTDVENPAHHWTVTGDRPFVDVFEPGGGRMYRLEKSHP